MFSRWFSLSRYSHLPSNIDDNESEKSRSAWLQTFHAEQLVILTVSVPALVSILVAIALVAGLVGFSLAFFIFREQIPSKQTLDVAPQGNPPSSLFASFYYLLT